MDELTPICQMKDLLLGGSTTVLCYIVSPLPDNDYYNMSIDIYITVWLSGPQPLLTSALLKNNLLVMVEYPLYEYVLPQPMSTYALLKNNLPVMAEYPL